MYCCDTADRHVLHACFAAAVMGHCCVLGAQRVLTGACVLWCRGFTAFKREDFIQWKREGRIVNDGVHCKVRTSQGLKARFMQLLVLRGFAARLWYKLPGCGIKTI